MGISVAIVKGD